MGREKGTCDTNPSTSVTAQMGLHGVRGLFFEPGPGYSARPDYGAAFVGARQTR
jgi:hypothetical protein